MQKVILTGATGLVGSRFVELYRDRYAISNLDITSGCDITDLLQVKQFISDHPADTLIHLAAFTDTARSQEQSGDKNGICYKINVIGTKNIAQICKERNIHLIHVSTDFVFDGYKETPYAEDDPVNPLGWYGSTKVMAEKIVQKLGATNTIVRLSYPYRAHYDLKPDLIQKIRTGLENSTLPPQFNDTILTPTFIDDIARAFDKIIGLKHPGILHTVGSSSLSPFELAQKVALIYDFDPSLVKEGSLTEYLQSSPRPFARHVAVSNQKASKLLGLHFATFDEGLAEIKKQQGL